MTDLDSARRTICGLTRAELHAHAWYYFKSGGATEPEVVLVVHQGVAAIFKDYARTPGWFGRVIAPILIWREASALTQLDGLDGIPRLYRRLDRRGLVMQYLPATPWPQARAPALAYRRLAELLDAMHARGVAHGDLRAPSNLLVSDDGTPCIVDFVARVRAGARWNPAWNWLFREFVRADRSALAKLRNRFAPELATAADREMLKRPGRFDRAARAAGQWIRRIVRRLVGPR